MKRGLRRLGGGMGCLGRKGGGADGTMIGFIVVIYLPRV